MPDRTPECRAALALLGGAGADGAVEACGGALFDDGDNLEVRLASRHPSGLLCTRFLEQGTEMCVFTDSSPNKTAKVLRGPTSVLPAER